MSLQLLDFVSGERPERFGKGASRLDAPMRDLEDKVSADRKVVAHESLRAAAPEPSKGLAMFLRVNLLDGAFVADDLDALVGTRPYAIMRPKAEVQAQLVALDTLLYERVLGGALLPPIATGTPAAIFGLGGSRDIRMADQAELGRKVISGMVRNYRSDRKISFGA